MARVVLCALRQWDAGPELGYVPQVVADVALETIADRWDGNP
jgi:hypothetical protein